ncbi:hypothetical protein BDC45DRAFT_538764 [Circinella umbellata]|nr:hypothetical protein BDC45DRAFT_538764 [Circinella umbellata]
MRTEIGNVIFESKSDTKWNNVPVCSPERLDMAYKQLHSFVFETFGASWIGTKPKHQKEELMGQQKPIETTIVERLNENNKEVVLISSTVPIVVKGLFLLMGYSYLHNLCVYYFSTRKHAQIINPSGKVVIGVLHHVDSYLNSEAQWFDLKDVMKYETHTVTVPSAAATKKDDEEQHRREHRLTGINRATIIDTYEAGILKKSSNHTKATKDIRKYENSLDQRRTLPHNVLLPIQEKYMLNNPLADLFRTWLVDRLKEYKDYDRLKIFKKLDVSTLEQVCGVQSNDDDDDDDDDNNNNSDDDDVLLTKHCAPRNEFQ